MNAAVEYLAADRAVLLGDSDQSPVFVAMAAENMTPARLEHLHELGGGTVVLGLEDVATERLGLRTVEPRRSPRPSLASIDAATVVAGGWSAADRALTMRTAADPLSGLSDLNTPGHVHPIEVGRDDLLARASAAAAALELARISGKVPAVALSAVAGRRGHPVSSLTARSRRDIARLPHASPADVQVHHRARRAAEMSLECALPTRVGAFELAAYVENPAAVTTLAMAHGDLGAAGRAPLVYVHHACLLGDTFGSRLCECRAELDRALHHIVQEGAGVLIYVKPATATYECVRTESPDAAAIAGLLRRVGVGAARLEPHSPRLMVALRRLGLQIEEPLARVA